MSALKATLEKKYPMYRSFFSSGSRWAFRIMFSATLSASERPDAFLSKNPSDRILSPFLSLRRMLSVAIASKPPIRCFSRLPSSLFETSSPMLPNRWATVVLAAPNAAALSGPPAKKPSAPATAPPAIPAPLWIRRRTGSFDSSPLIRCFHNLRADIPTQRSFWHGLPCVLGR